MRDQSHVVEVISALIRLLEALGVHRREHRLSAMLFGVIVLLTAGLVIVALND